MSEMKNAMDLGNYISLLILNNKLCEHGIITETTKNKLTSEINLDYQRIKAV